jgi:hypothetical protein
MSGSWSCPLVKIPAISSSLISRKISKRCWMSHSTRLSMRFIRISALSGREEQLRKVRDDLLPRVKKADPICQPDLIKKIHEELDIGVRALNEQLRLIEVPVDSGDSADESEVLDLQTINPALDLVDGTMILLAPQKVRSVGNPIPRWQNTQSSHRIEKGLCSLTKNCRPAAGTLHHLREWMFGWPKSDILVM